MLNDDSAELWSELRGHSIGTVRKVQHKEHETGDTQGQKLRGPTE